MFDHPGSNWPTGFLSNTDRLCSLCAFLYHTSTWKNLEFRLVQECHGLNRLLLGKSGNLTNLLALKALKMCSEKKWKSIFISELQEQMCLWFGDLPVKPSRDGRFDTWRVDYRNYGPVFHWAPWNLFFLCISLHFFFLNFPWLWSLQNTYRTFSKCRTCAIKLLFHLSVV